MKKILITAGIHGDEIGGVLTARELKGWVEGMDLKNVEIIPEVNKKGIEIKKRENPIDDKDLNRLFPGDEDGTSSERIVHELFEKAKKFDYLIDLHTYGTGSRCVPYMLTNLKKEFNKKFCKDLGLDYAVQTSGTSGQLFIELSNRDIPSMIIEVGGAEWLDDKIFGKVKKCVKNFILGIEKNEDIQFFNYYERLESNVKGFFEPIKEPGEKVDKDEVIGFLEEEIIKSPFRGLLLGIKMKGDYDPDKESLAAIAKKP